MNYQDFTSSEYSDAQRGPQIDTELENAEQMASFSPETMRRPSQSLYTHDHDFREVPFGQEITTADTQGPSRQEFAILGTPCAGDQNNESAYFTPAMDAGHSADHYQYDDPMLTNSTATDFHSDHSGFITHGSYATNLPTDYRQQQVPHQSHIVYRLSGSEPLSHDLGLSQTRSSIRSHTRGQGSDREGVLTTPVPTQPQSHRNASIPFSGPLHPRAANQYHQIGSAQGIQPPFRATTNITSDETTIGSVHKPNDGGPPVYRCHRCSGRDFIRPSDLTRHWDSKHEEENKPEYFCPHPRCKRGCSGTKPFSRNDKMVEHARKMHPRFMEEQDAEFADEDDGSGMTYG